MKEIAYEDVVNFDALMKSADQCRKNVMWKPSTQNFWANQIGECAKLHEELETGSYKPSGFSEFYLNERGKVRHIRAVKISERVVQKSLVQNCLRPLIEPRLIYDNSASIKEKGTQFALSRLKKQLSHHYKKCGRDGGILVMDYHSYFDSIDHNILLGNLRKIIKDDKLYALTKMFIDAFPGSKGLGLGSEVSQICAIFYTNGIDHYIKEQLHIEGYGRYMDDSYVISNDIDYLKFCKNKIEELSEKLGLKLNPKATQIVKFKCGSFEYLKKRIKITESGKILMRLSRKNITQRRKKLKSMGKVGVPRKEIAQSYTSWKGYAKTYDATKSIETMEDLFLEVYYDD